MAPVFEKLPSVAKPSLYKLELTPDLEGFKFKGKVSIDVQVEAETAEVELNAVELEVSSASVTPGTGAALTATPVLDAAKERLKLTLPSALSPGPATIAIDFTGILNDTMHGWYRSKYTLDGKEKYMATTQFESTYARKAFPCFDEPVYKFEVTLNVAKGLTALSNMPEKGREAGEGGLEKVVFQRTPKMSTYLLAFIVGEFDHIATKTAQGVDVRVFTLPGKQEQGRFALDVGKKALEYYHDYFKVPYPLPKSDLIAIPDFSMGAMENWGLVTYREVYLLVDEKQSSQAARCHIALIVGHELAHMWFGNLATMKWWTDLWLKEGFATFMEYTFVGANYPEFSIWMQFANDEIARAFGLDALRSSHPIEVPIENPNELDEIYDSISYSKSSSVIGMLHNHLGDEVFRKGTSSYLSKFSFANAETADLWAAFSDASGHNIAELMGNWTQKMGFPLVTAAREGRKLKLKQERFLADGSSDAEATLWRIPISLCTASHPDKPVQKLLLTEKEASFDLDAAIPDSDWVKLNADMKGYYRVAYSPDMLKPLLEAVKEQKLGPLDRFNLVIDVFALVRAGKLKPVAFLELLEACTTGGEGNYNVWVELDAGIGAFFNVLSRSPALFPQLKALVRRCYSGAAAKAGWEPKPGESYQDARLRSLLIGRLAAAEDADTIAKAQALFDAGPAKINADLRGTVFAIVGRSRGQAGFEALKALYETSDFPEVQRQCLLAFGRCNEPAVHTAAIAYSMDKVRSQDLYMVFGGLSGCKEGQESAWAYLQPNFDKLVGKFGSAKSGLFQAIVKASAASHASEDMAKAIEAYFEAKKIPALARPVAQCVESVRLNAALLAAASTDLPDWLASRAS